MSEIKQGLKSYSIKKLIEEFENTNLSTYNAGFKNYDIVTLPNDGMIKCRVNEFNKVKYAEIYVTVNGRDAYKSLGSLYRQYKINETDEFYLYPNGVTCLKETLEKYCGKTIKLHKVFDAIAPKYNEEGYQTITVYKAEIIEQ